MRGGVAERRGTDGRYRWQLERNEGARPGGRGSADAKHGAKSTGDDCLRTSSAFTSAERGPNPVYLFGEVRQVGEQVRRACGRKLSSQLRQV